MIKLFFIITLLTFISCGETRKCSFKTLDDAVNCGCEFSTEKVIANSEKEIIENLKKKANTMNASFEKAIEDGVFTEKEFINQLRLSCENFK